MGLVAFVFCFVVCKGVVFGWVLNLFAFAYDVW